MKESITYLYALTFSCTVEVNHGHRPATLLARHRICVFYLWYLFSSAQFTLLP